MKITVVGLGELGSPLAAALANGGHDVVGVDVESRAVRMLAAGQAPVVEPGLHAMLDANRTRLPATSDLAGAVAKSDATFLVVPTATKPDGTITHDLVLPTIAGIGEGPARTDRYHVVLVTSTVMPGTTAGPIAPALAAASGRTVGVDVGLCYGPGHVALSSSIDDIIDPDVVLIGESDARAGAVAEAVVRATTASGTTVERMILVNAKMARLAINAYVSTRISFSNMLADLCERIPGADVDVVTNAIGHDRRVGHRNLRAATSYGGPCLPRDTLAVVALAEQVGADPSLPYATHQTNQRGQDRLEAVVRREMGAGIVGVLGLSFMPATSVIEKSPGVALAVQLAGDRTVVALDPLPSPALHKALGERVEVFSDLQALVATADTLVLMTPDPYYRAQLPDMFEAVDVHPTCVIDCWRLFVADDLPGTRVVHLGKADAPELVPAGH